VTRISELGTTLAITSNRRTLQKKKNQIIQDYNFALRFVLFTKYWDDQVEEDEMGGT
jgi:hypothetical protein